MLCWVKNQIKKRKKEKFPSSRVPTAWRRPSPECPSALSLSAAVALPLPAASLLRRSFVSSASARPDARARRLRRPLAASRGGKDGEQRAVRMEVAMDLMRQMPPRSAETVLNTLLSLLPDHSLDLLSQVDLPLQVCMDKESLKEYILCEYNRDADSNRSPWSNKYDPPLEDGTVPSQEMRNLEFGSKVRDAQNSAVAHPHPAPAWSWCALICQRSIAGTWGCGK